MFCCYHCGFGWSLSLSSLSQLWSGITCFHSWALPVEIHPHFLPFPNQNSSASPSILTLSQNSWRWHPGGTHDCSQFNPSTQRQAKIVCAFLPLFHTTLYMVGVYGCTLKSGQINDSMNREREQDTTAQLSCRFRNGGYKVATNFSGNCGAGDQIIAKLNKT